MPSTSQTFLAATQLAKRGHHVIPLVPQSKAAVDRNWTKSRMTLLAVEDRWQHNPEYGVGVLLGTEVAPGTFLVAIDIDRDDEALIERIRSALPGAPAKKGAKGLTLFAQCNQPIKKKLIKTKKGETATVEVLGLGQQTVVPPSIHPSGMRYTWVGRSLEDFDPQQLPVYDPNVAREIETAVKHPDAKWWGILDMKPASDGEPGSIHDSCVLAVASMIAFGQPDDWIARRVLRAMEEVDARHGHSGRDYEREHANIEEWIRSAHNKKFDEVGPGEKSPYVVMSEWVEYEWRGPGGVFVNAGTVLAYRDGHYETYAPDQLRHALAHCGNETITGLPHKHLMELSATALDYIKRFPVQPTRRVCLQNGTYDMDTGEMMPWSKDDFLIAQLDFEHDPDAACPRYEQFLRETFAHDDEEEISDCINAYEEFVAMTMFECHDYHKFLVLEGTTRSGKGVLSNVARMMHSPRAVCSVMAHDLGKESSRTSMLGKLVNITGETSTVSNIADEYLKTIVAGEPIEVRHLYQGSYTTILPTRFIIATNDPLKTKDTSGAVLERMLLLRCDNHRPEGQRDPHLSAKLRLERAGIFNRMATAWRRLRDRGQFKSPKSLVEVREQFAEDNNPVLKWVNERTVEGIRQHDADYTAVIEPKGYSDTSTLYLDYVEWAKNNGFMQMNVITFGTKLCQIKISGEFLRPVNKRIPGKKTPVKVRRLSLIQPQRY